jgi:hypothetical protein
MEAMAQVWPADIKPSARKFVAVAMADECRNADGTGIFPSLQRIAAKVAVSRDQARRHVQSLVAMGVLEVEAGARQHRATSYRLRFDVLQGLHACNPYDWPGVASMRLRGGTHAVQGLHPCSSGVASMPPNPRDPKDPMEPLSESGRPRPRPADAGRPSLEIPNIGKPELWQMLQAVRADASSFWSHWLAAAKNSYPEGGPELDACLQNLIAHPHRRNLAPDGDAAQKRRGRHSGFGSKNYEEEPTYGRNRA